LEVILTAALIHDILRDQPFQQITSFSNINHSLEGVGQYILKKNLLKTGFGGVYDDGSNLVAAQWAMDNEVSDGALTPSNTLPCTVAVSLMAAVCL
jgi:hypothetical protein